ncbi:hypothetical protein DL96DRAFT_1587587 [Flagelloscypha sp. PMI_526]|nr:hypothetical protein DL96DRAFT_1587587 [Flagelloscypha sp. PMI_526]
MAGQSAVVDADSHRAQILSGVVTSFNVINGVGLVLTLAILLTTLFTRRILRPSTFYVLLISLMGYMLFMLILAIGGAQLTRNRPEDEICLFQGTMLQFAPVWLAFATAAYALQMWQAARGFIGRLVKHKRAYRFWLIAAPVAFAVLVLILALGTAITPDEGKSMRFKAKLMRDNYGVVCWIASTSTLAATYTIASFAVVFAMFFTFMLVRILVSRGWLHEIDLEDRQGSIRRSTLIRLVVFLTCLIILLGISFPDRFPSGTKGSGKKNKGNNGIISPPTLNALDGTKRVFLAIFPLFMALTLGLQSDVLRAWMFWRKEQDEGEQDLPEFPKNDTNTAVTSIYTGTSTRFMSLTPARTNF